MQPPQITRRQFAGGVAAAGAFLGGCLSEEESDVTDSDGDGVVDSHDYAPRDPAVQERADLETAATAAPTVSPAPTATASPTQTATTVDPTTVTNGPDNVLSVQEHLDRTHVVSYSATEVTLEVWSVPEIPENRVKLLNITYTYPRDEGQAVGTSESFAVPTADASTRVTVSHSEGEVPRGERVHHVVFAMPEDEAVEDVSAENLTHLYETDPFRIDGATRDLARDPPAHERSDDSTDDYERDTVEGAYLLSFSGQTNGRSWDVGMYVWKSAYSEAYEEPRGRSYREYVAVAQDDNGPLVAGILDEAAEANGFTEKPTKVEFVIDWVQSFPYVTDDVGRGFDDYPKLLPETLVDVNGDCEDTSILLAAVLQSDPFGYDMVLIQPPTHMATGIYGTDLPGHYWELDGRRYYYIETTGEGWGIGDLPDEYQGASARVHQV